VKNKADRKKRKAAVSLPSEGRTRGQFRFPPVSFIVASGGIAALTLVAFFPALFNDFTNWDDNVNLVDNPFLLPPTWDGFLQLWRSPYENLYVPLFYTSYYLDILFCRGTPRPWITHLLNVAFHTANTLIVGALIRHFLKVHAGTAMKVPRGASWQRELPWVIGTALFAIHPIQTEVVAWATGRKDLVAAFFCLLAWWLWEKRDSFPHKRVWQVAPYVCFLLALLAKPASVALPLVLAGSDWIRSRTPLKDLVRRYAVWATLSIVWVAVTAGTQEITPETKAALTPWWTRPFVAADALLFYFWKIAVPLNFAAVYGRTPAYAAQSSIFWLSLPAVIVILFLLCRKRSLWAFATVIFVAFFLPVSGLLPFAYQRYSTVADRYVYLSMIGVGLGLAGVSERMLVRLHFSARVAILATVLLCSLLLLVPLTWQQCHVWRNGQTLWEHSIRVAPHSAVAHANLGVLYALEGHNKEAQREYERAIELDPNQERAHANLGLLLVWQDETTAALAHLQRAIEIRPHFAAPYSDLGDLYARQSKFAQAAEYYRKALDLDPRYAHASVGLAYCLYRMGRFKEAEEELSKGLAAHPNQVSLWIAYGNLLSDTGRPSLAVNMYEQAVRLDPKNVEARNKLEALRRRQVQNQSAR